MNNIDTELELSALFEDISPMGSKKVAVVLGKNICVPVEDYVGYVYIWRDSKRNKFYIGSHAGQVGDGYLCSSLQCRRAIKNRPLTFNFRILTYVFDGDEKAVRLAEQKWLDKIRIEDLGSKYYNLKKNASGGNTIIAFSPERYKIFTERCSEASKKGWRQMSLDKRQKLAKDAFGGNTFDRSYMKTPEYSKAMTNAVIGEKNGFFGKQHSADNIEKARVRAIGNQAHASNYEIVSPDGTINLVKNLHKFLIEKQALRNISRYVRGRIPITLDKNYPLNGFIIRKT